MNLMLCAPPRLVICVIAGKNLGTFLFITPRKIMVRARVRAINPNPNSPFLGVINRKVPKFKQLPGSGQNLISLSYIQKIVY